MEPRAGRIRKTGWLEACLPAELESALAARKMVSDAVSAWRLDEPVGHDAALVVSELVTNSVLHASTPATVRIGQLGFGLRIVVEDGSGDIPALDAATPEDLLVNQSMTGRGLALVAAMSDRWGAEPTPGGGKLVWAEVGTGATTSERPPQPRAAAASGADGRSRVPEGGRRVHMMGVPVDLLMQSTQHMSDLQRELHVMALGHSVPPEIEEVVRSGRSWITGIDRWAHTDRRVAESAAARGQDTVDFDVDVPDDFADRVEGFAAWLRGSATAVIFRQLLTLPVTRDVADYRRWYRDEIVSQLSGEAPRSCPLRPRRVRAAL